MQWWADLWNNWAKTWGYEEWVWGSAADWFAAIGTVGALLVALGLFQRERLIRQREYSERVRFWMIFNIKEQSVTVTVLNSSSGPIFGSTLVVRDRSQADGYRYHPMTPEVHELPADERAIAIINKVPRRANFSGWLMYFEDAAGKRWLKGDLKPFAFFRRRWHLRRITIPGRFPMK